MGLGIFSLWDLLRRRLGVVDLSGDAAAGRALPVGAGAREVSERLGVAWLWRAGWLGSAERTRSARRRPPARFVDMLATFADAAELVIADDGSRVRSHSYDGTLVCARLPGVPPIYSHTQRIRVGTVHRQQPRFAALGRSQPASKPQRRRAEGICADRRNGVHGAQSTAG